MAIEVSCKKCSRKYRIGDDKAGRKFRCKDCNAVNVVPQPEEEFDVFADDFDDYGENYEADPYGSEDYEDEYDEPPRPKKKKKKRRGRRSTRMASLGQRLTGAIIDNVLGTLSAMPGFVILVMGMGNKDDSMAFLGGLGIFLGAAIWLAVEGYYLATRSQSIGKMLMGTRIDNYEHCEPAEFTNACLLRSVVNALLVNFIPFYGLIDILFIFGDERRCLHDRLSNTYVVDIS